MAWVPTLIRKTRPSVPPPTAAILRAAIVGGALVYKQERIVLMRLGEQITAMSLVCTHLGCTVSVTPDGMVCPCHGSRFDRSGKVLTGPAERPLPRLTVEQDGAMLVVRG